MSTVVARLGDDPNERSVDGLWRRVACPIVVGGRRWGAIAIASKHRGFPADTEERLADFTELVALAIANAEGQADVISSRARVTLTARLVKSGRMLWSSSREASGDPRSPMPNTATSTLSA